MLVSGPYQMTINGDGHNSEGLAGCTKETSEAEKFFTAGARNFWGPQIKMISHLAEKFHSCSCSLSCIQPNLEYVLHCN